MTSRRRALLLRIAFWATAVFAFVMAIVPHPPQLPDAPSDKVQHVAAFLVLGLLAFLAYSRTRPFLLGLGLSLFGALIEIIQAIPTLHRDSDPVDWLADTVAVALALIFLQWLRARRNGSVAEQR